MPSFVQDFGFVEWWKAIAVVLTGFFAFLALIGENKDKKTGKLTRWGMISILGIVISSVGGLLAQIAESSNQAIAEKKRHSEIISILTDQARLLRPLKIDKIHGLFNVPCKTAEYLNFCNAVQAFRKNNPASIMPVNVFDAFPGGRTTIVGLSLRFFANEDEAKAQLTVYDDQKSKHSVYMNLPLLAGNDTNCGIRVSGLESEVRLEIYKSCPFTLVNNFGGLQSYLDLNGLEFTVSIGPFVVGVPSLEPIMVLMVYTNAESDAITNISQLQTNKGTIYIGKFVGKAMPSRPD